MRQEIRHGNKIRELRRAHGWTQEHLAEAAQLEVRTIQRAEKDETKGAETLQGIAGALNVDLAEMRTVRLIPEHRFLRAENSVVLQAENLCVLCVAALYVPGLEIEAGYFVV